MLRVYIRTDLINKIHIWQVDFSHLCHIPTLDVTSHYWQLANLLITASHATLQRWTVMTYWNGHKANYTSIRHDLSLSLTTDTHLVLFFLWDN